MRKIIIFAEQDDREYQCHSVLFTYLLLNEHMAIIVNNCELIAISIVSPWGRFVAFVVPDIGLLHG